MPGKVFDALEKAGRDIMLSTSVCTQDVVTHRWVVSMLSKNLVAQVSDNSGWKLRSYWMLLFVCQKIAKHKKSVCQIHDKGWCFLCYGHIADMGQRQLWWQKKQWALQGMYLQQPGPSLKYEEHWTLASSKHPRQDFWKLQLKQLLVVARVIHKTTI